MNRPLTPSLSPSEGERVPGGRVRGWFMVPMHAKNERGLSMNRTPSSRPSPPVGEKVPGGRLRGIPTGSWPPCASRFWRFTLPMNRAGCESQTRGPDRASVRRSGSWSQCATEKSWSLSMNRACCGSQTRAPERASVRRSGSWPQLTSNLWRCSLPMNLVAADVSRRTCLFSRQRISAD